MVPRPFLLIFFVWAAVCQATGPTPNAANGPLAGQICLSTFRLAADYPPDSYDMFRALYSNARIPARLGSERADNQHFLGLLGAPEGRNLVYVHGMLKVLKELNDKLFAEYGGKEDVNAARNLFRIFLLENLEAHPQLSRALVGRFTDFKTIELAFDPTKMDRPETFDAEWNHVLAQTQIQFEQVMGRYLTKERGLLNRLLVQPGLAGDLREWHLFGSARGNPDAAAFMARTAAMGSTPERPLPLRANPHSDVAVTNLHNRIEGTDGSRVSLIRQLGATSPLFATYEGTANLVLSRTAIDILRKVPAKDEKNYIEYVKYEINARLGVKLTDAQVLLLRDHFANCDYFQPTIRSAERGHIPLELAANGAFSVDMAGQNVENMYHTMGALAEAPAYARQRGISLSQAIFELTRRGEQRATDRLNRLRDTFNAARGTAGITGTWHATGDDGAVFAGAMPTDVHLQNLYHELRAGQDPISDYRLVWVPPMRGTRGEIDAAAMSREAVKGETLEKNLRTALHTVLTRTELQGIGFTVLLQPNTNSLRLVVSGASETSMARIRTAMNLSGIIPRGYRLSEIRNLP